jgi:hypothetical protein
MNDKRIPLHPPRAASWRAIVAPVLSMLLILLLVGCDDLLTVENPGEVLDGDLDTELAVQALVNGVAGDFNWAYHYVAYMSAHLADELLHTGSDVGIRSPSDGSTTNVPSWSGRTFDRTVLAIFVAEDAVRRFSEVIFDDPEGRDATGIAHVYAGFAMLMAADNLCEITINSGPAHSPEQVYNMAEDRFNSALVVAGRTGNNDLRKQALAGRARARVALQNWAGAQADAAEIPEGFQFWAIYSLNSAREENIIAQRGRADLRRESGVHPRFYTDPIFEADPRTSFTDRGPGFVGADGLRQFVEQNKFPARSSDMLISSWQEARLLEAEAALRQNQLERAVELIDEVRAAAGLDPYDGPVAVDGIWEQLIHERAAELWLQAQRLRDLRRTADPYTEGRDVCFPISETERNSNPNV